MIISAMKGAQPSSAVLERLNRALWFLRETDVSALPDGTYPVEGDEIYAMVQSFHVMEPIDAEFETHRQYIDIQYVLEGCLEQETARRETLQLVGKYDAAQDVVFYARGRAGAQLRLYPGEAAVFFPWDAHRMVCVPDGGTREIRKCVVKVRFEEGRG